MDMWRNPPIGFTQVAEDFMGGFSTDPSGYSLLAKK